ncbi:MAG: type II toxin-antitoxin system VapC family toxin [Nitrospirota bacterium]|nr:type II toxin-antitoxin system VapC family toxin [Nitrospirota bacterium]
MNLYAESSAVLSWLLAENSSGPVLPLLSNADLVIASDLTLIECDRVLIRATTTKRIPEAQVSDRRALLARVSEHWTLFRVDSEIVARARQPFPQEPIRTLDAIHLATAIVARNLVPEIQLLTLDDRLRICGAQLGFEILPH